MASDMGNGPCNHTGTPSTVSRLCGAVEAGPTDEGEVGGTGIELGGGAPDESIDAVEQDEPDDRQRGEHDRRHGETGADR